MITFLNWTEKFPTAEPWKGWPCCNYAGGAKHWDSVNSMNTPCVRFKNYLKKIFHPKWCLSEVGELLCSDHIPGKWMWLRLPGFTVGSLVDRGFDQSPTRPGKCSIRRCNSAAKNCFPASGSSRCFITGENYRYETGRWMNMGPKNNLEIKVWGFFFNNHNVWWSEFVLLCPCFVVLG